MKFIILLPLLTASIITLAGCSKKEEPEHVRVQSEPPEVVAEVQKKVEQEPTPKEITDEDRERMKKELQDPNRFENSNTANKSAEKTNAGLIDQLDSIGQQNKSN